MIAVPRPAALWMQLRRWRWPAALGSMLAFVGLLLAVIVVPSLQREQAALDQQATSLRSRLAQRGNSTPPATPGSEALRYRDGFPQPSSRQQRVAALLNAARDAGLAPKRSEFRYEADRSTGLARYRVALPLEGRYAQLRGFIDSALRADAALSLDSVRLRRSSPQQPLLQAELAFTLHMRDADARAANERAANERAEGMQPSSTP